MGEEQKEKEKKVVDKEKGGLYISIRLWNLKVMDK